MTPALPARRGLTVRETSIMLGFGRAFIYELLLTGRLPATKIGGAWRIDKVALEAGLERDVAARTSNGKRKNQ